MISHGNRMLRILKHGKIIHTVSKYICPIQFHPEFFQDYIAGSPFTVAFLHNFIGIASAVNCFHIFLDKRKKFLKIAFLLCINEHLVINEIIFFEITFQSKTIGLKISSGCLQTFKPSNPLWNINIFRSFCNPVQIAFRHFI